MRSLLYAVIAVALSVLGARAGEPIAAPRTFLLDPRILAAAKQHPTPALLKEATEKANAVMEAGPFTVTRNPKTPPSGNKHDYTSLARYAWPNPNTPDHLPYVTRDGQSNPEIDQIPDHADMFKMQDAVHALALGYYFTGKEDYAARAALLLRTWFLKPETMMRPNLNYAQFVPGKTEGRGDGIIDSRGMIEVIDAIGLIGGSASWSNEDQEGMHAWFASFSDWLANSRNGQTEFHKTNNHGTWYDVQTTAIALFLNQADTAKEIVETAKGRRIDRQISPDGSQPLELKRTNAFSYSVFNLQALTDLADYGDRVGIDLWNYHSSQTGGIRAAFDFLLPYVNGEKPWDYKEIKGFHPDGEGLRLLLLRASVHYHDSKYALAAEKLGKESGIESQLLAIPAAAPVR